MRERKKAKINFYSNRSEMKQIEKKNRKNRINDKEN